MLMLSLVEDACRFTPFCLIDLRQQVGEVIGSIFNPDQVPQSIAHASQLAPG
jgi:hypothetical protein